MPLSTKEAESLLQQYYPNGPGQSNIHGRLYASRITALMPSMVEFFRDNKDLVPPQFQQELASLTDADLEDWQRVAMMRASGRNTAPGVFEDKNSGSNYAANGSKKCEQYLISQGMSAAKAQQLAKAIVEADPVPAHLEPKSLLGWMLKNAAQLETLRDQKNKGVKISQLPAWKQASGNPQLESKLTDFAQKHYQLIHRQQGFACVELTDPHGKRIYPPNIDNEHSTAVTNGKQLIRQEGQNCAQCFQKAEVAVNAYHPSRSSVSSKAAHRWDHTAKQKAAPATPAKNPSKLTFADQGPANLAEVEKQLQQGKVLTASKSSTLLDKYLQSNDPTQKSKAADLLTTYAVKNVMNNLQVPVTIKMVDNVRANSGQHDSQAMQIKFASQQEAQEFSQKLLKDYGIGSLTFGPGVAKTAQNGSIFLTKDDLEKISKASNVSLEPGAGITAYQTKASLFTQSKKTVAAVTAPKEDDKPTFQP